MNDLTTVEGILDEIEELKQSTSWSYAVASVVGGLASRIREANKPEPRYEVIPVSKQGWQVWDHDKGASLDVWTRSLGKAAHICAQLNEVEASDE